MTGWDPGGQLRRKRTAVMLGLPPTAPPPAAVGDAVSACASLSSATRPPTVARSNSLSEALNRRHQRSASDSSSSSGRTARAPGDEVDEEGQELCLSSSGLVSATFPPGSYPPSVDALLPRRCAT